MLEVLGVDLDEIGSQTALMCEGVESHSRYLVMLDIVSIQQTGHARFHAEVFHALYLSPKSAISISAATSPAAF